MSALAEMATAPQTTAVTGSPSSNQTGSKQIEATKFINSTGGCGAVKQVRASTGASAALAPTATSSPVMESAANQMQQTNKQAGGTSASTNTSSSSCSSSSSTPNSASALASSSSATTTPATTTTVASAGGKGGASRNNNSTNNSTHNTSTAVPMGKFKAKRPEPLKLNPNLNQEIPLDLSVKSAGNVPSGGMANIFNLAVAATAVGQSNTTLETPRIVWQDNESLLKQRLFAGAGSGSVSTPASCQQRARLSSAAAESPPVTPHLELLCSPAACGVVCAGGASSQQSPHSGRTNFGGQRRLLAATTLLADQEVSPNSTASRLARSGSQAANTNRYLGVAPNGERSFQQQQLLFRCNNSSGMLRTPRRSCSTENLNALASFHQAQHQRAFKQQYQACEGDRRAPASNRFLYSGQQVAETIGSGYGSGSSNTSSASSGASGHQPQSPTSAATMAAAAFTAATVGSESQSSDTLGSIQQALTPAGVANATANLLNIHLNSPTALAAAAAAHLGSLSDQLDPLISAAYCQQQQHHSQGGSGSGGSCSTSNGFPSLGGSCSATLNTPTLISPSQLKGGSGCFLPSPTLSPLSSVFELPSPLLMLPNSTPETTPTLTTTAATSTTPLTSPSSSTMVDNQQSMSPPGEQQSMANAVANAVTTAANRFVQQQLLQSTATTVRAPSEPTLASNGEQRGSQLQHQQHLQQLPPAAPPSSKASSELALNCTAQLARPASLAHLVTAARDKVGLMDDDCLDDDDGLDLDGHGVLVDDDDDDDDDEADPAAEVGMDIEQQDEQEASLLARADHDKQVKNAHSESNHHSSHINLNTSNNDDHHHHLQQQHKQLVGSQPRAASSLVPRILVSDCPLQQQQPHLISQQRLVTQQQQQELGWPASEQWSLPSQLATTNNERQQQLDVCQQQSRSTKREPVGKRALSQQSFRARISLYHNERLESSSAPPDVYQGRARPKLKSATTGDRATKADSYASLGPELGSVGVGITRTGSSVVINWRLSDQHKQQQLHQQQQQPPEGHHYKVSAPYPEARWLAGSPQGAYLGGGGSRSGAGLTGVRPSSAEPCASGQLAGAHYQPHSQQQQQQHQSAHQQHQQLQQQQQQQQHQWTTTSQIQQQPQCQNQLNLNLSQQFSAAAAAASASTSASPYSFSQSVQHLHAAAAAASGAVSSGVGGSQNLATAAEQYRQQQQQHHHQQSLGGQFPCQSSSASELHRSSSAAASNNPFGVATHSHNHHHTNNNHHHHHHHHHAVAAAAAAAALGRQLINPPPQSSGKCNSAESRHQHQQQPAAAAACGIGSGAFGPTFQQHHHHHHHQQHQLMGVAQQQQQHHHHDHQNHQHHQPRALSADGRGVGLGRVESPCSVLLPELGFRSSSAASSGAQKKYQCDQCIKSFTRSDMLTRHKRLHSGDRPFQCNECKQEFSRSDHLSTHMRTHTGEKPYKCKLCSYSACRKDMITRHMKVHNRSSPNAAPFEPATAAR